ncbi:MAG: hypothetical protein AAFW75_03605 [Cyanobacteria bacterium J06636_16]
MLDYEMEFGLDGEFEADFESDYEADGEEFIGALASILPTVAPLAIKAVGSLLKEAELEAEFELELEADFEADDEFEFEFEADWESAKPSKADRALMNHLAIAAANSQNEAEAEAFIGALTSLAAKAAPIVAKHAPTLIRGVARVGRQLMNSPTTKRLVRTLPTIAEGTVKTLAGQVAQGRPVNSRTVLQALGKNTHDTLRSPRQAAAAIRRNAYYAGRRVRSRRRRPAYSYR